MDAEWVCKVSVSPFKKYFHPLREWQKDIHPFIIPHHFSSQVSVLPLVFHSSHIHPLIFNSPISLPFLPFSSLISHPPMPYFLGFHNPNISISCPLIPPILHPLNISHSQYLNILISTDISHPFIFHISQPLIPISPHSPNISQPLVPHF